LRAPWTISRRLQNFIQRDLRAPQEIIQSALEGIVPPDHIFGTRFRYNEVTGEVDSIIRASAGWGKITVLEELRASLGISHDHIIYMGDGSSDLPVMMHVNHYDALPSPSPKPS